MQEHEPHDAAAAKSGHRYVLSKKVIAPVAIVILFLLSLSLTNYATYSWQHGQLTAAKLTITKNEQSLKDTKKQLTDETAKTAAVNQQYQALLKLQQQAPPTQADLQLTVGKATAYSNGCCSQIGIIVTLKNTTSSNILIQPEAYKLKDSDSHTFTYDSTLMSYFLGSDFESLHSQSLAPGETVTGALGYDINDKAVTSYTLVLGNNSYKVVATQK
jgi:hypothetical protein